MTARAALLAALVAAASACDADSGGVSGPMAVQVDAIADYEKLDYPATRDCGIVTSDAWSAIFEESGDGDHGVYIDGIVGAKPSASFEVTLDPAGDEAAQRVARLAVTHPEEPTIDLLDKRKVDAWLSYRGRLDELRLMCGTVLLATFRRPPPDTAGQD